MLQRIVMIALVCLAGLSLAQAPPAKDAAGWTPSHEAARAGTVASVTALLEAGAAVNAADKDGVTALHVAAGRGDLALVTLLLARGATPLFRALDAWAFPAAVGKGGRTPYAAGLAARDGGGPTPAPSGSGSSNQSRAVSAVAA